MNGVVHDLGDYETDPPINPHLGGEDERLALYVLHSGSVGDVNPVVEHVETRYVPFRLTVIYACFLKETKN